MLAGSQARSSERYFPEVRALRKQQMHNPANTEQERNTSQLEYRFYLKALGATGLFVAVMILIWIVSGGPASEAAVRDSNFTRTSIAMTGSYLLQPRTRTPEPLLPQTGLETSEPGIAATITPLPSIAPTRTAFVVGTAVAEVPILTLTAPPGRLGTKASPVSPPPPTPILARDPSDFARWYFKRVWNERDYQELWEYYLTPGYKTNTGSGLYEDYVEWWDSVERVDVNDLHELQNNGSDAWVRVDLTFHMQDGRVVRNQIYHYDFRYDPHRGTWMFDSNG
jgi:hypothetical protein